MAGRSLPAINAAPDLHRGRCDESSISWKRIWARTRRYWTLRASANSLRAILPRPSGSQRASRRTSGFSDVGLSGQNQCCAIQTPALHPLRSTADFLIRVISPVSLPACKVAHRRIGGGAIDSAQTIQMHPPARTTPHATNARPSHPIPSPPSLVRVINDKHFHKPNEPMLAALQRTATN